MWLILEIADDIGSERVFELRYIRTLQFDDDFGRDSLFFFGFGESDLKA